MTTFVSNKSSKQRRLAGWLLAVLCAGLFYVPEAAADCPAIFGSSTTVVLEECVESKSLTGGGGPTNSNNIAFDIPATVNAGDLLIVVITPDDDENFFAPNGWELLFREEPNGSTATAAYKRIAGPNDAGSSMGFSWGSLERAYGYLLHFTGTNGNTIVDTNLGSNDVVTAPSVTTVTSNNLILRVAGFDDDDLIFQDPTGTDIIDGTYTNITIDESDSSNGASSGAAAFTEQAAVGATGVATFGGGNILSANEGWVAATIAIEPGAGGATTPSNFLCPGTDESQTDPQLVVLKQCTEAKGSANTTTFTIDVPSPAVIGDLLVAIVANDSNVSGLPTEDADWTPLFELNQGGADFSIYTRVVDGTEPASYNWTYSAAERQYGVILLFDGASGLVPFATDQATTITPTAPALITNVANSLIIRAEGHDDDDQQVDVATIVAGQNNITADVSNNGGNTTGAQATYLNQTAVGSTGTLALPLIASEGWVAATLAVEPIEFRFSTESGATGESSVCGVEEITLSVTDRLGNPMTWFTGQVSITATNSTGATWSDGTGLTNSIVDGGNGNATYQFDALDGGTATFEYYNPNGGVTVDFGVSYTSPYGSDFSESTNSAYTNATLDILDCEFRIAYADGSMGTCSNEAVTISLVDINGNAATNYSGTLTINNGSGGTHGNYTLNTGNAPDFNDAVADDGLATYAFNITSGAISNSVTLDYSSFVSGVIDFDITEDSGLGITDDDGDLADDPNLTVLACEIRLVYPAGNTDLTSDTCSIHQLTIQVVDELGALATNYTGTVTIVSSTTNGVWSTVNATNAVADIGNGNITYTFAGASDGGDIVLGFNQESGIPAVVDFNITENVATGYTHPAAGIYDQDLDIAGCTIDIQIAPTTGICAVGETMTVTIRDRDGNPATDFDGEIEITANLNPGPGVGSGDYALTPGGAGGNGTLTDTTPDDGIVRYDFNPGGGDAGVVEIDFSTSTVETLQFVAASTGTVALTMDGGSANDLDIQNCEVRITVADTTSDVCSIVLVTFEVYSGASVFTNFDGLLNLDVNGGLLPTGDWAVGSEPGTLDNTVGGTGNGQATYQFNGTEGGNITLEYRTLTVQTGIGNELNFDVSGTDLTESVAFDPDVDIAACTLTITTPDSNTSDVCRSGLRVVYSITDRDSAPANDFLGLVVLQTDGAPAIGDYTLTDGLGTFDNLAANDGVATYQFVAGDDNEFEVTYSVNTPDTIDLTASSTGLTIDNADGQVTFGECTFRIEFIDATPGATDVCSTETVRITLVDSGGVTVDDYTGTISLSTNSGDGTWAVSNAEGTVFDPTPEDGAASYTFVDDGPGGAVDDDGVIELTFTHTASNNASVNIDVTDTITTDPGSPGSAFDPNLSVDLCTFQISFDGGVSHNDATVSACAIQQVTIEVYNSQGVQDTDYDGTISISTTTNNGNWAINNALGTLNPDPDNDDNGAVEYSFVAGDGGDIVLDYTNVNPETTNVDIVDLVQGLNGVIVVDGAADPNLQVTSCFPDVQASACVQGGGSPSVTVDTNLSTASRMALLVVDHEGTDDVTASPTFGGQNMTFLFQEKNTNSLGHTTEVWGILDADFPAGAGPHAAAYAGVGNGPTACLFYLTEVEQDLALSSGTDNDPINGSQAQNTATASTTVTTQANNSIVFTWVGDGSGGGTYDTISPNPPIGNLTNGPDPTSGDFAYAWGTLATQAAVTVDITRTAAPNRHANVVAAFAPFITGPPIAVGYVPVTLFETYSGNISYLAVGNTTRLNNNAGGSCNIGESASARLDLPETNENLLANYDDGNLIDDVDSTVVAAYLYWFGAGDTDNPPVGETFEEVTFIDPSLASTVITADEVFDIENVGSGSNLDYYAAYKDVTPLVTGSGVYQVNNINNDDGTPWSVSGGVCAGGFSLIVIYDNPFEQLRVINLFHGFQPFQNSSFTLIPRNFRMDTPDAIGETPNGLVTHVTVEGDETIFNGDESLKIQDLPGSTDPNDFIILATDYNPAGAEFNGTVTRPVFELVELNPGSGDWTYQWDGDASGTGPNGRDRSGGYEIDFSGPDSPPLAAGDEPGASWGVDIDTHYISGDENFNSDPLTSPPFEDENAPFDENVLYPFAVSSEEEITTRYSSGQDLVLLVSEVISVVNAPIADLEVFITETSAPYQVNSTGTYQVVVTNNGNGATSYGSANGNITLTGVMPAGYSFALATDVDDSNNWDCTTNTPTDPGAFICTYDITTQHGVDGLDQGDPTTQALNFTVTIDGPPTVFPSLNNDAKVIVRMQHDDGTCLGGSPGVMPDPTDLCAAPEFDNVNDLQGGAVDIDDLDDKTGNNNNVDSVTTNVKGVETDLAITKVLSDTLEPAGNANYTITITNNGPDDIVAGLAQPTISVTDTEPSFIDFQSVTPENPGDWTCNLLAGSFTCDFDQMGTLAAGNSTFITLNVNVTGTTGQLVSNTASVSSGLYNFDIVSGNNSDTDNSTIQDPPAAATERFLLSVSTDGTTLGGLAFDRGDLIVYDPILDTAEMFLDNSAEGYGLNDINAVHLLPNGHVILSTSSASSIGTGGELLNFDANDLVLYDPITKQTSLFFDGASQTETNVGGLDIDAVYVLDNGNFVFSTAADNGADWDAEDLVLWDGATFSLYLDGSDPEVFDSSGPDTNSVDAAYIRVDPSDATAVIDTFIISSNNEATIVAQDNGFFGQDDVIEVVVDDNLNPTTTSSDNLFAGNVPIGVFSPVAGGRRINALHVLEDGYLGAFAITESQAGTACEAGKITITKRQGLTASPDTDYTGTIVITTDTMPEKGIWSIEIGNGTLDNSFGGDPNNGQALYTFVPSDNGQVTLNFNVSEDPPVADAINIDVTNGIVVEDGGADPTFNFNLVVSNVTYRDDFAIVSFANNTGSTNWANDWQEVDDENVVMAEESTGNVTVSGGKLNFTSTPSTTNAPQASRIADLSLFNVTETVSLNFDYTYSSLNASDEIEVIARLQGSDMFTPIASFTGLTGTNSSPTLVSLDLTAIFGPFPPAAWTDTTEIGFRIVNGYTLSSVFSVDNVSLETGTTDCGIGSLHHYAIIVPPSNGLACITSQITIEGRDVNNLPVAVPALTAITLSTSTGAGTWADNLPVVGTLVDTGGLTDGQASYTFPATDVISVTLPFNYTDPTGDGSTVNFNISGAFIEEQLPATDPDFSFDEAGVLFYNETTDDTDMPFQIAGKPSLTAPSSGLVTVQLVRSVPIGGENPAAACESLLDDGEVATFSFGAVCSEYPSGLCPINTMSIEGNLGTVSNVPVVSAANDPLAGAVAVPLLFQDQATVIDGEENIGAVLDFTYMDVGQLTLHAEFDIPVGDDINGLVSGDVISGASETFVVRPFGFDIDFGDDRRDEADVTLAESYAADFNGTAFARTGTPISTTVKAVAWAQDDDDIVVDGNPDSDADLSNNPVTPSFGGESTVADHTVILSIDGTNPGVPDMGMGAGGGFFGNIVSGEAFVGFANGISTQNIEIDEIGIFDMNAVLVDNPTNQAPINYLGLTDSEGVLGRLTNFGRVYPHSFEATINTASFIPRINQNTMCVASSPTPFTYLGEQFEINIDIQAKNGIGNDDVRNYVDDFAFLTTFAELDIRAIIDQPSPTADIDLGTGTRLLNDTLPANFSGSWVNGRLQLQGRMNLARQASGVEEAPLTNVQIAFAPIDDNNDGDDANDVILNLLDVDLDTGAPDPGPNIFKLIENHEFRYGRMLIENAFGPETEDLEIPIRIEYFDGTDFITNIDDNCTELFFDFDAAASVPPEETPRALDFVVGSFEGFTAGDTDIENDANATINVFGGFTGRMEDGNESDEDDPDRPFFTTAPDPDGDGDVEGRALIQLQLDHPALDTPLDFLSYDWRGDPGEVDDYDEIPDGDYSDNPRGVVEFGSYRGHDRVINWQEIYIGN